MINRTLDVIAAARERLPIVFLVMDNGEYAILKAFGTYLKTPGVPDLDLGGIDFVGLAGGRRKSAGHCESLSRERGEYHSTFSLCLRTERRSPSTFASPVARRIRGSQRSLAPCHED
jgi:hypothetical protein